LEQFDPERLLGQYSIAFDLISSEYGWTDEEIYNLTFTRFRQIVAAIERRKYLDYRQQSTLISWQTRNLAQYIAAGYMLSEGTRNEPLENAQTLSIDKIEAAQLEEAMRVESSIPVEEKVKPGSWERLQGTLGRVK